MWFAGPPHTNRGISTVRILEVLLSSLICDQISFLRNSKVPGYVLDGTVQTEEKIIRLEKVGMLLGEVWKNLS